MKHNVKCLFCGKVWEQKDPDHFLTYCGVCIKSMMLYFESQFMPKLLKAGVLKTKHLRIEDDEGRLM